MVALERQYNVNDPAIQSGGGNVLIPAGDYQAVFTDSEMKSTDKGGNMLVLKCSIVNGSEQGTELVERLNIVNSNPVAEEIAYGTLAKISKAMGLEQTPADSSHLHNRPVMITVKTIAGNEKKDDAGNPIYKDDGTIDKWPDKSEIKGYKPVPSVGTQQAAQMQPVTGTQPVAQPQPTQAAPATAQAPTSAPWNQ